jgi:hypothetical protein
MPQEQFRDVLADAVTADENTKAYATHYFGFSFRETAGSTATIRVYDALTATGTLLDSIQLAANESAREFYGPDGIKCSTGVYVDIVSGTVEGSVRVAR